MSSAVNGGVQIHYEIEGNGIPLVLQHGFSQSLGDWYQAGSVDALKFDYQLILVDARGHGEESDKPYNGTSYGLSSFVGDVVTVLDALGIERAPLLGLLDGRLDPDSAWPWRRVSPTPWTCNWRAARLRACAGGRSS